MSSIPLLTRVYFYGAYVTGVRSWNVLGLQGSLASEIFDPLYIDNIIIGDVPTELQNIVREDCKRAFWGRLEGLNSKL